MQFVAFTRTETRRRFRRRTVRHICPWMSINVSQCVVHRNSSILEKTLLVAICLLCCWSWGQYQCCERSTIYSADSKFGLCSDLGVLSPHLSTHLWEIALQEWPKFTIEGKQEANFSKNTGHDYLCTGYGNTDKKKNGSMHCISVFDPLQCHCAFINSRVSVISSQEAEW